MAVQQGPGLTDVVIVVAAVVAHTVLPAAAAPAAGRMEAAGATGIAFGVTVALMATG